MNYDEEVVVKSLEERLNSLGIDDDANEAKQHESLEDLKEQFKDFINRAKHAASDGNLEKSLTLYKKAYKIHKSEKVLKRIDKLERKLEEYDDILNDDANADDDDEEDVEGFKLPKAIHNKLYPYQIEGVMWFWKLYEEKKGGILGDDMGLGKTIQVISFLAGMFRSGHVKTVLIVMPVSLLSNWEKEFKKWAPEIRVVLFHGSSVKQRTENLGKIQSRKGVCLTTYGLACSCSAQFSEDKYGGRFTWDYIILDEGHKIKNTANKTTIAIRAIPAANHFILTGTPVQNNLKEMWALFDFVCQGQLLGTSRSFKKEYEQPIVRARERDASAYEKRMGQEISAHLRELIAPHFLRRTKDILEQSKKASTSEDVKHHDDGDDDGDDGDVDSDKENVDHNGRKKPKLTRKNDFIIWLYLSQTQLQIYEDFVKLDRVKEILMTTKSPLAELNVLKKICDHPRLLSTMACKQLGLSDELDDEDTECKYEWCSPPVDQLVEESGKLVFLLQLLVNLKREGHRTLVFSQSRKMLDIIQKVLKDKGIKMIRIDGTVDNYERESRICTFQTDPSYSVFLLTTQVGGVGLTLTAADRVVIFDPSWNPATDAQAVDRAYRIGQKRTVVIYRLITCGSLEEKIYRKQVFKQAITKQTTGSSINPFRYFSRHELRELFVLDDHRSSKTQIQLEKMHSTHRVTDNLLDQHIAFLYSTDIFGISDHDLLFTKEAVATEDEISGSSEMNDAIQAKVRRAADIMRTESSQAIAARDDYLLSSLSKEKKKKNQTKIHEHMEVFIPSSEDSTRFKPGRKKSQSPASSGVIDLTVLDAKIDDDGLEQKFSDITLKETVEERNMGSPVKRKVINVLESDSEEEVFTTPTASTSSDHEELGEPVSQCSSENDEGDGESHTAAKNHLENVASVWNDDEDSENVQQITSPRNALITSTNSMKGECCEKSEVILPTYTTCCPEGIHVSESFNIKKCPCVLSPTETQAHKNVPESPPSSDVIDLPVLHTVHDEDDLEKQFSKSNETDDSSSDGEGNIGSKVKRKVISVLESDSEEEVFTTPTASTSSGKDAGVISENLPDRTFVVLEDDSGIQNHDSPLSDHEELDEPVSQCSSENDEGVKESHGDVKNDSESDESSSNIEENSKRRPSDSTNSTDESCVNSEKPGEEEDLDESVSQYSSENDEGSHRDVENDSGNDESSSNIGENSKRSPPQRNTIDSTNSTDESCVNSEKPGEEEDLDESVSQYSSENDEGRHSDDENDSGNDESSSNEDENSKNFQQSPSSRNAKASTNAIKDESLDKPGEPEVILKTYTTCCPEGIHVSESFNIKKCQCVMSPTEIEAYKMHVNSGRRCEKSEEFRAALKHFSAAYRLCDSDERLRTRIQSCYKRLQSSTS
ncbi:DNA excision repair protein ERCC-6-like [Dendronephthya gigantea]|uniref:DNA excision repair protein ERCC-6-like n=1 Tax=Dendronephthya gigantea TaxID=151771 RepID=UPI00106CDDB0|nr:DNA excision repair protein ERCC-6-like [Dendronephthya gigantea]